LSVWKLADCSDLWPQRQSAVFSPGFAIPREAKNSGLCRPPLALRPCGCGRLAFGPITSIEAAMVVARSTKGDFDMATIGTFTKNDTGFAGTIQTLGLKAKISINPVEKGGDAAPDYRAHAGKVEDRKSTRLNSSHVKISYAV